MVKKTKLFQYIVLIIYLVFNVLFVFSQEEYNNCMQAKDLCPNVSIQANNIKADKTLCTDCEDDFSNKLCFSANNSVWFKFYTNDLGGDVNIFLSNISFLQKLKQSKGLNAAIIKAKVPCDASTYSLIGNCQTNAISNFNILGNNLLPNETYYVVITGILNQSDLIASEATFELSISGTAVNRKIPSIFIEQAPPKLCKNNLEKFHCSLTDCPDSTKYHWFINDTLFAETDSSYLEYGKFKQGDWLTVSTSCFKSCPYEIKDSTYLKNLIDFNVYAGKDTTIYSGTILQMNATSNADSVRWSPSIYLSDTTISKPFITPYKTVYYTFTGIKNGCRISDNIKIHVIQQENKPSNSFSPNGDNINDVWEIPFLEDFPNCHIQVFTRWGQTVFETTGYTFLKSWDGKYNGSTVDPGTYFYVIDLRDAFITEPIKGSLTIIQ
jgi:gliding motility-associated-like protein